MRLKYRVYSQDKNAHWSCWRGIVVVVLLVGDLWLHAAEWGKVAWLDGLGCWRWSLPLHHRPRVCLLHFRLENYDRCAADRLF